VDRQSRNVSKLDSSEEEIISSQAKTGIHPKARTINYHFQASRSPNKQDLVCLASMVNFDADPSKHIRVWGNRGDLVQARPLMASLHTLRCSDKHHHHHKPPMATYGGDTVTLNLPVSLL
jgi:hypothetical protein